MQNHLFHVKQPNQLYHPLSRKLKNNYKQHSYNMSLFRFIFLLVVLLCTSVREISTFRSSTTISKIAWGGTTKNTRSITILSVSSEKEPHPPNNRPPTSLSQVPYFLENDPELSLSGKEILSKGSNRVDQALPKKPTPPNIPPPSDILEKENSYFSNVEGTPAEIAIQAAGSIFGPLFKSDIERNVSKDKIAGVALASASYGLLTSMSIATSSVAALGAAYVAIHPGAAGKVARLVGSLAWSIGKTLTEELNGNQRTANTSTVDLSSAVVITKENKPLFADQDFLKVIEEAEKAVGLAVENEKKFAKPKVWEEQSLKEKEFLKALEEAEKAVELAVENEKKIMEEVVAHNEKEDITIVEEKSSTKPTKKKRTTTKKAKVSSPSKAEEKQPNIEEEARIAEEKRLAVIARLEEEKRFLAEEKANEERIKAEKAEVEKRLAQKEAKTAEDERIKKEKELIAAEKKIEEERIVAEKKAEEELIAAQKKIEEERIAAEKQAEKERIVAKKKEEERVAEEKRIVAEKKAEERIAAAEKQAEEERLAAEENQEDALVIEEVTAEQRRFEAIAERAKSRRAEVAQAAAEARRQRFAEENEAIEAAISPQEDSDDQFIDEEDWEASVDLAKQLDPELYGDNDGATSDYFDIDTVIRDKAKMEIANNDDNKMEQISLKRASIKDPEKIIDKLEAESKYIEEEKLRNREEWDASSNSSEVAGNFEQMTVAQLKEELRNQGLKVSGRKAELIERLRA